jgi:hypothetical protein
MWGVRLHEQEEGGRPLHPDDHPLAGRARQAGTTLEAVLRRSFRFGLTAGVLLGLAFALVKVLGGRRTSEPEPAPFPARAWPRLEPDPDVVPASRSTSLEPDPEAPSPPARKPAAKKATAEKAAAKANASSAWVEPSGDVCPTSHPVKAKLSSKIFHLPGMLNYDRTKPDRCYRDGGSAEADGLRPAKR